ncbi:hypothetical protein T31B1_02330 [Salinisphaera sp. T31B1]
MQKAVDSQRFDEAVRQSDAYLETHPGNRDARFVHARALAGLGRNDDAIAAFESLAADYPLRPEPANNLAVLYARQGDYDTARQWLDKALATQPAYAVAHRNLGDIYTALADLAYRRALGSGTETADVALTLLDRLYYAQESVAPGDATAPAPTPARPRPEMLSSPAESIAHESPSDAGQPAVASPAEPPPLPAADASNSLVQTVRAWALAWSSQDFDAYTDFYGAEFEPGDGMDRSQWLALRRARLERPDKIHIRIEDPSITQLTDDRARVDFVQDYDSPRYSDRVRKRLILERTPAGWRIVRESSSTP